MTTSSPTLASILRESALIWTRSFTLVYVYFLFGIIASMLIANPMESLDRPDIRFYSLAVLIFLIFCANMAGLYQMTGNVCRRFLKPTIQPPWGDKVDPLKAVSFSVFKDYLPGIGQYFLPVVLGIGLQIVALFALMSPLFLTWAKLGLKLQQVLLSMIQSHASMAVNEKLINSLSIGEQNTLAEFFLFFFLAMLGYGVFWVLTCLWPVMMLWYAGNPFKAYWLSLRQFFRDPFRLLALIFIYWALVTVLFLLTTLQSLFVELFVQVAIVLLHVGFLITLFVYAWRVVGPPTIELEVEAPKPLTSDSESSPPPLP